ncbi:LysM peptidoglycan-binding domain-containing protein [Luteolibacter sp. SL250]|uniref:LysM peptidoglycan-binding domain-containing protein n=1 Tax=Luteolibacter sp. SL250 TaxID=2995170 RepID=UPI00226FE3EB|nr:LysM peptidoglycan-binding domain-containing protein [Luteolibacter sp. SL250]WAC21257.1 LysM peptidoglycan-binding domain-containing protein [Luteolibacter sp. SL250]
MKTTLWLTTFSMLAASPLAFSNPELDKLRALVTEQDRQIRQLEEENTKLRHMEEENIKLRALKEDVKPAVTNTAPAKNAATPATAGSAVHTVKAGDTLARISRNAGTTPAAIARLNGIKDPSKLRIGQKLKLPGAPAANTRTAAATPSPAPAPANHGETYVVRDGDTFYSIARKHKVSAESLIAANPDIKPSAMRAGQLVRLQAKPAPAPVAKSSPAPAAGPAEPTAGKPTPESTPVANHSPVASRPTSPSPAEIPDSPAPVSPEPPKGALKSVIIDGEITYGEFAAKHGTQIDRLNELNGLDLMQDTVLAKGSELYVNAQP